MKKWVEILRAAPVLNRPDFQAVFGGETGVDIPRNSMGHPEAYEFVALPGMCFSICSQIEGTIFQIAAPEYCVNPFYIDIRFGKLLDSPKKKFLPPFTAQELLRRMEKRVGTPYVWGGNWGDGIAEMLEFYPPAKKLDPRIQELWTFHGVDCSGLLFEASLGATPRNTSALVTYGQPLQVAQWRNELRTMDMIVYPGHVLFVRDAETIIESKSPMGVRIAPLQKRLDEIMLKKKFVQHWEIGRTDVERSFTIRRFCAE